MADQKGFSHITVTPDQDDDIVIQAGAVDRQEKPVGQPGKDPDPVPAPQEPVKEKAAPSEASSSQGSLQNARSSAQAPDRARKDDYRETTLSDLSDTKMSTAQKAVIAVALLGIVAFAVWYLLAP